MITKALFLICDHASNFIPKKFNNLGLSSKDTLKHIAWDIGSKKLTLSLARQLKSSATYQIFQDY